MVYAILFLGIVLVVGGIFFYFGYSAGREVEKRELQTRQANLLQTMMSIEAEEAHTKERILQEMSRASASSHTRRCPARYEV